MFPDMRRKKQMLSDQDSVDILTSGIYGVLGTAGTDAWPYAVPISYAFDPTPDAEAGAPAGRIYLHSAVTGHKLEAIEENPHVSFAVVTRSARGWWPWARSTALAWTISSPRKS